jgi:pilus assembly protein CpaF
MSLRDRLRRRSNGATAVEIADEEAAALALTRSGESPVESVGSFLPAENVFHGSSEAGPNDAVYSTLGSSTNHSGPHHVPTGEISELERLKVDIHRRLIERLDLKALEEITDETALADQIREAVIEFLREEATPLAQSEREEIVEQVVYEITGLGPLEPLFRDSSISDILVNGAHDIYVERRGRLQRVSAQFRNDAHLISVIDRIVSRVGRRIDESSPMVDARLPDGSRVNAIIPPLALDGPVLSIRRFGSKLGMDELVAAGTLTRQMAMLLAGAVHARLNILISGGTGSGKTTLLNALSSFVPTYERIVTIEDAAELRLQQAHVVRLETRPPNVEGRGEVVARDLVRNALRMRPDRIIIGEVRAAEVIDMLQAMNTGHEGSLATIHANTPRDALARLETMILMSGTSLPVRAMREQIASAIDVIVQIARMADGSRRVVSIAEVAGIDGDVVTTSDLFEFRRRGVSNGRVVGTFMPSGVRPRFMERFAVAGITLPPSVFDESVEVGPDAGALDESEVAAAPRREWTAELAATGQRDWAPPAPDDAASRRRIADLERRLGQLENENEKLGERSRNVSLSMLGLLEALDDVEQVARQAGNPSVGTSVEQLARRTQFFVDALNVTTIEPKTGDRIDDAEHEVVRRDTAGQARATGLVRGVVQRGFRVDGKVARRAQVVGG